MVSVYKHLNDKEETYLKLNFTYLPVYATFLLENKLHEFVKEQIALSKEFKLPLLKFLEALSEEQLIELGLQTTNELLKSLAENKAAEYIRISTKKWLSNQLPAITKSQVIAEDIALFSFLRRKIFRHFISAYTTDINLATKILDEV